MFELEPRVPLCIVPKALHVCKAGSTAPGCAHGHKLFKHMRGANVIHNIYIYIYIYIYREREIHIYIEREKDGYIYI